MPRAVLAVLGVRIPTRRAVRTPVLDALPKLTSRPGHVHRSSIPSPALNFTVSAGLPSTAVTSASVIPSVTPAIVSFWSAAIASRVGPAVTAASGAGADPEATALAAAGAAGLSDLHAGASTA